MFSDNRALCRSKGKYLVLAATASFLAGCAVYSPPQIQESTGSAAGTREVAFIVSEGDSGLRVSFREHLQMAFRARGVVAQDDADVVGDFAIATMPAGISLASTKPNVIDPAGPSDIKAKSIPRDSKLLDNCDAVRFRASLVLFDRVSGERIHRAEGESEGCEGNSAPLDALAEVLVRDALLAPR